MKNRWSDAEAARFVAKYAERCGEDLALRIYLAVLIACEDSLVLHAGGNSSVKTTFKNVLGETVPVIYVKAARDNTAAIEPEGYIRLDLGYLRRLRALEHLSQAAMLTEFQICRLDAQAAAPSIETLAHALLPKKYIDHTHAGAVLALTNQPEGRRLVQDALGPGVEVLEYVEPGFGLAQAAATAFEADPESRAMVWMGHGLVTWGETARESYETLIELTTKAEDYVSRHARRPLIVSEATPVSVAEERCSRLLPVVRGLLARPAGNPDIPHARAVLQPLITREVLDFMGSDRGKESALTAPLTRDHLILLKPYPLWITEPGFGEPEAFRSQVARAIKEYTSAYDIWFERYASRAPRAVTRLDPLPRVVLIPGMGAVCAGKDVYAAQIVRDLTARTLAVKAQIAAMGTCLGIPESELFDTEHQALQEAQLGAEPELPLSHQVAIVTGAAGAIGSGIAEELLENGCHVAVSDVAADALWDLVRELQATYGARVAGVTLDVTSPESVADGFRAVSRTWGGVDLVIVNAGLALVSRLSEMDLEAFRRLERVNLEGTLLVLAEAARHFKLQNTGGDIIVVSTKNVFAPGAQFGAYSATKSAAHQLARIASLELAEMDVRVNMVSPDAVFAHKERKSGLWAEVGPSRMAARGLDPKGLEEYYRSRNLLKAKVTAEHVAKAVLFFATRQTPTTGATLPVDGGLPDATPR